MKIINIERRVQGHALVTFENGVSKMFEREKHEDLKVGEEYPRREVANAMDAKASEAVAVERQSAKRSAKKQDEA